MIIGDHSSLKSYEAVTNQAADQNTKPTLA
jgi:hypothetical protein